MTTPKVLFPIPGEEDITIFAADQKLTYTDCEVLLNFDGPYDEWAVALPWVPGDNLSLDAAIARDSYSDSQVYIGQDLVASGRLYVVSPQKNNSETTKSLRFFSYTIDHSQSEIQPPYQFENSTVLNICKNVIQASGSIVTVSATSLLANNELKKPVASPDDKVFEFLAAKCKEQGCILSHDIDGNFVISDGNLLDDPRFAIKEGDQLLGISDLSASYDGSRRFNQYKVKNQTPLSTAIVGTAFDVNVPEGRNRSTSSSDITAGNAFLMANWVKNKAKVFADELTIPVAGFLDQFGKRFQPNTMMILNSPTLEVVNEPLFIRAVKYSVSPNTKTAELFLVPPIAYALL